MMQQREYLVKKNLLLKNGQEIGIYGTGLAGVRVLKALSQMNINVRFFLDGEKKRIGEIMCGRQIADINKISKVIEGSAHRI